MRVCIDLKVFELLSKSETPLSLDDISRETNAEIVLIGKMPTNILYLKVHFTSGRIMRYLSSAGMMKEIAVNTFAATRITKALANPGHQAGVRFLLVSLDYFVT